MNGSTVYLDTSSIVKRYIEETGSSLADRIYARCCFYSNKVLNTAARNCVEEHILDTTASLLCFRSSLRATSPVIVKSGLVAITEATAGRRT
jgi:predicted nucleic acid-binding protein